MNYKNATLFHKLQNKQKWSICGEQFGFEVCEPINYQYLSTNIEYWDMTTANIISVYKAMALSRKAESSFLWEAFDPVAGEGAVSLPMYCSNLW